LQLGATARLAIGVMLILSPWAAYFLNLLHGIADGLAMLAAVVAGFLLVASGMLHMRHHPSSAMGTSRSHRLVHGVAVAGLAIVVLLVTARALSA
jgi:hypothetical protein